MPGAASRLDAELMSKGPQRQTGSHSPSETADWGRSSADCCSAVPPTQQRRRDGEAALIAIATKERIDPGGIPPARLSFGSHERMSQRLPYPRTNSLWGVPLKSHLGLAGPNRAGAAITLLRRDSSGSRPCG
jgi:hypothetical protein